MIVAVSSQYIRRPWCIDRQPSKHSPTGYRFRVSMRGEMRQKEAVSLHEALTLVRTMTREGER